MLSIPNPVNVGRRKPEILGDSVCANILTQQLLNGIYVVLFQFGVKRISPSWRFVISSIPRMSQILGVGTPMQVFNRVVELVKVLVVNLRQVIRIGNERQSNKAMNSSIFDVVLRSVSKSNGSVTVLIDSPFKQSRFCPTPRWAKAPRSNLTVWSNFVQFFVAPNRGPCFSVHKLKDESILGYVNV